MIVVVPMPNDGNSQSFTGYELDLIRHRQKANREKIEKYAKMKKRVNKYLRRTE